MELLHMMRAFQAVAESSSFTAAARQLDTSTTRVSRAVSALESHLQTRLLQRTTRRVALTEAGERYLARCISILNDLAQAESEARDARAHPTGRLRVHAMTGIGQYYLVSAIAGYRRLYPSVQFDLTLSNRVPDLLEEGYDVAIVVARELPDSGLVAQRIGETFSILCASPGYAQQRQLPLRPEQLREHEWIGLVSSVLPLGEWTFRGSEGETRVTLPVSGLQVNVGDAVVEAIRAGMGIGAVPHYSAASGLQDGSLVHVLPAFQLQPLHVYALYPSRRYLDAKVRTWVDYLQSTLPSALSADARPCNSPGAARPVVPAEQEPGMVDSPI